MKISSIPPSSWLLFQDPTGDLVDTYRTSMSSATYVLGHSDSHGETIEYMSSNRPYDPTIQS